uniref:Uncharacterized protein n=1 Tax=Chromera velia CCMP2878 TaxID=1169474 RepID=A0A0G4HI72_9ALVE|mmetsp:Transcript_34356/g.67921  ORF Transcript_34356/g.67921 Transcript_34356/m.67921 type:complete len:202 (+) Transcript_34356:291-896(+)|eukprot:Cvel_6925.t1-p1 / transcript=Cvel_6925.t1 / gene=Cvel_6925 / organism=Chromera_velia_CCMP2878 / gene_product=Intraflagellar transport protein 27 homolog, putative / transcript_product=Intraflagellar transport protein 27 homolog, putative / location=Cvel_scaffold350:62444-66413(-) / protein_length=201 / sequence_SO=supercontig / SO=protein_coding / is_pseudo=false
MPPKPLAVAGAARLRCKVMLLGDQGVGKTSLAQVFAGGQLKFRRDYTLTRGVDLVRKVVQVPDSPIEVELFLLDSGGGDIWGELLSPHYATADAFAFVYDITDPDSVTSLARWYKQVLEKRGEEAITGVVIANKRDLGSEHTAPSVSAGQAFSKNHGLEFFEATAPKGDVEAPLDFLAELFANAYEDRRQTLLRAANSHAD